LIAHATERAMRSACFAGLLPVSTQPWPASPRARHRDVPRHVAAARAPEPASAELELRQRPLGRLTGLIAAGPAAVSFDDEELPQAGSAGARGEHAAGDAPGAGPRAAQGAGWERELLQLAALLPPALRDALLAHERFLEARRPPAPDPALLHSALCHRAAAQRPGLLPAAAAPVARKLCPLWRAAWPYLGVPSPGVRGLAGRLARAPRALVMSTCELPGNTYACFAWCPSRQPVHALAL
jgi:hypothetical protein